MSAVVAMVSAGRHHGESQPISGIELILIFVVVFIFAILAAAYMDKD